MTPKDDFLPPDYKQPKTSGGYLKFEKGETKFRVLSKPVMGWLDWDNKKPVRFRMPDKPARPIDPEQGIKHFWAFVVWDYKDNEIKILEITQSSIQSAISALAKDDDWGSPFDYDIKITKSGENLETKYVVSPVPHKPISEEIKQAFKEKPVNLEALFTNDDPYAAVPVADNADGDDLPF